jgi:glycosyltransferase involved in cell wall biosynthesis
VARGLAGVVRHIKVGPLKAVHVGLERRTARTSWAHSYTTFLSNSAFTAGWVTRMWKVPSTILYPPVRPEVTPGAKTTTIASVGRFFDPKYGHCKNQLDLLNAFIELERQGTLGWRLELVGGADASSREYALAVRRNARGHSVGVHFNAPRSLVRDTLATATLFWHASGFGEDPDSHPERFEHFGIAVVEAMAAGAVPVVFGAAGPAEIVRHGVDGFHWRTPTELVQFTRELIADPALVAAMSASAQQRAREFSSENFSSGLRAAVAQAGARA